MAFTPIKVKGTVKDGSGNLLNGRIIVTPVEEMQNGEVVVPAQPVVVKVHNGIIDFELFATNDPGTSPFGAEYHFELLTYSSVRVQAPVTFTAQVPYNAVGGEIDWTLLTETRNKGTPSPQGAFEQEVRAAISGIQYVSVIVTEGEVFHSAITAYEPKEAFLVIHETIDPGLEFFLRANGRIIAEAKVTEELNTPPNVVHFKILGPWHIGELLSIETSESSWKALLVII